MISAQFVTLGTRELCQLDANRQVIPRSKQTMFCAELHVGCRTGDGTIDLEFLVRTEVPFSRLASYEDNSAKTTSVGLALAKRGIPILAKRSQLQIYGGESLSIPGTDSIPQELDDYRHELNEEISEALAAQLKDATARHRDCTERFEKSKDYLTQNTGSFRHEPMNARRHANFVAEYMRKSSEPFMGPWNSEKSAVLLSYVDDLIRRKNSSHPGFVQAAEWIGSTLYSVRASKLWHSPPF